MVKICKNKTKMVINFTKMVKKPKWLKIKKYNIISKLS